MNQIQRIRLLPALLAVALVLFAAATTEAKPTGLVVLAQGQVIRVLAANQADLLDIQPILWGPHWSWTGTRNTYTANGKQEANLMMQGDLGGTKVPFVLHATVGKVGTHKLRITVSFRMLQSTDLTAAVLAISAGSTFAGPGRTICYNAAGVKKAISLPAGNSTVFNTLRKIDFKSTAGRMYRLGVNPPISCVTAGDFRLQLATKHLAAGVTRRVVATLTLPTAFTFYPGKASVPPPAHWSQWFAWNAKRLPHTPSVISMKNWLGTPAGKFGWIKQVGSRLMYHGRPIKLWGVNTAYSQCAPPRSWGVKKAWYKRWGVGIGSARARFYARYGINLVRLHKFADGPGWAGICSKQSFVRFNPLQLSRLDSFINQLRLHGIYCELSANFGAVRLGPVDAAKIPYAKEWPADGAGWRETGEGALWFSPALQKLQIEQEVNFLKHRNSYTGGLNADDPAIFCVELVNENDIFFWTTAGALRQYPAIKALAGQEFFRWLRKRYGSKKALLAAWGARAINAMAGDGFGGESWSRGIIYPDANLWEVGPQQLAKSPFKARLLDTLRFLYHRQNAFYHRYVKAIRGTGYKGLIVTSNWQAGSGYSNYLNLNSDATCGNIIDRHNYFTGRGSMLVSPGDAILSSGMEQVENRPFMLSEWSSVFPNQFGVEGPAIIGAYGMGLNGWDSSQIFAVSGRAGFDSSVGQNQWQVNIPQIMGIFPAVARQILRGDVRESKLILPRYVCVRSLFHAKLGFTDNITQNGDVKTFTTNKVPAAALAVGRCVVTFTKKFKTTPAASLKAYRQGGMWRSSTGQLGWHAGTLPTSGFITVNTPGTQAVVGFAAGRPIGLKNVVITSGTRFAAIYVTALGRHGTIATGHRILVTTIARVYNTGMKMVRGYLINAGNPPMRMEPVKVDLTLKRPGTPTVYVLNDAGQRTGKTLPVTAGHLVLNGAATHAIYYELVYP